MISDLSAIQSLSFSGTKAEWLTWSEKFLAKAKRSGIKDILMGKILSPLKYLMRRQMCSKLRGQSQFYNLY
jgi:hypothetical protein